MVLVPNDGEGGSESRRKRRRRERAERDRGKALEKWQARRDAHAQLLEVARTYRGGGAPVVISKSLTFH